MKEIFTTIMLALSLAATPQNIGVGTSAPTEKLDVNGNLNVRGTIKVNGADGLPNQVLMKSGNGNLEWRNLGSYQNLETFVVSGLWTVPSGVNSIAIELWGAGGGGGYFCGAGGGGYIVGYFRVRPGETINYTVGNGGGPGAINPTSGGSSSAIVGDTSIFAMGAGASLQRGRGGNFQSSIGFNNYFGIWGEAGKPNQTLFIRREGTDIETSLNGDGGNGANSENTGGLSSYIIEAIRELAPISGKVPGGGGGAGYSLFSGSRASGTSGGNGLVRIRY